MDCKDVTNTLVDTVGQKTNIMALQILGLEMQLPSLFSPSLRRLPSAPVFANFPLFTLYYPDPFICAFYTCSILTTPGFYITACSSSVNHFFDRIHKIDNLTVSYPINQLVALNHNSIPCPTKSGQLERDEGQYISWGKTQVLWSD